MLLTLLQIAAFATANGANEEKSDPESYRILSHESAPDRPDAKIQSVLSCNEFLIQQFTLNITGKRQEDADFNSLLEYHDISGNSICVKFEYEETNEGCHVYYSGDGAHAEIEGQLVIACFYIGENDDGTPKYFHSIWDTADEQTKIVVSGTDVFGHDSVRQLQRTEGGDTLHLVPDPSELRFKQRIEFLKHNTVEPNINDVIPVASEIDEIQNTVEELQAQPGWEDKIRRLQRTQKHLEDSRDQCAKTLISFENKELDDILEIIFAFSQYTCFEDAVANISGGKRTWRGTDDAEELEQKIEEIFGKLDRYPNITEKERAIASAISRAYNNYLKSMSCPVCFRMYDQNNVLEYTANCNHSVCVGCLQGIFNSQNDPKCPECRADL